MPTGDGDADGTERKLYDVVNRYAVSLAVAGFIVCGGVAVYFNTRITGATSDLTNSIFALMRQIFYSFASTAALFVALYFLLSKSRLTPSQIRDDLRQQLSNAHMLYLREVADKFPASASPEFQKVHYGSFNSLQIWDDEISRVHRSIDIIVYYYDSWVKNHAASLRSAAERGVSIRLFLPDPEVAENIAAGRAIFPELDDATLRDKINRTKERFSALGFGPKLSVIFLPHPLSYAAQCFDDRKLLLSFFEYGRKLEISSPLIEFNLTRSEPLRNFWHKEVAALLDQNPKRAG